MTELARPLKVGFVLPIMENWVGEGTEPWREIKALALHAEAAGFDSVWVNDHLLFDLGEPGVPPIGGWESWSMLCALAAVVPRVEIGTTVTCTAFRNPALLAKMADTVDEICDGRLILGLGGGYHELEFRAFGFPYGQQVGRFEEALRIIHPLLRTGRVDFVGAHHSAKNCELRPRATRPGGPPLLIGARPNSPRMLRLMAQYADEWNIFAINSPDQLQPYLDAVDAACIKHGRDPASLGRTVSMLMDLPGLARDPAMPGIPKWRHARPAMIGKPATGTTEELADLLRGYARVGIRHVHIWMEPISRAGIDAFSPVLELLDRG